MKKIIIILTFLLYFLGRFFWSGNKESLEYIPFALMGVFIFIVNKHTLIKKIDAWIYLFYFYAALSIFWAVDLERAQIELIFIAVCILTYSGCRSVFKNERLFIYALKSYVWISVSLIPIGLIFANDNGDGSDRFFLGIQSSSSGWMYVTTLLILYLLNKINKNNLYIYLAIMCASVFVVNQSFRSILTVAIFIAAINISVKKIIKSILTIIGLVFVILYYVDNVEMNGRLADYVNGIRMFIENPVLADLAIEKGLNGSQVRITLLVEGVKYLVNNITILGLGIGGSYSVFEQLIDFKAYSHNNLINVLMDLGLIGGILYYVPLYKMITIAETREMRGVMTGFSVSIFMAGFYGGKTHIILPVLVMMAILISYNEHVKRKNTY